MSNAWRFPLVMLWRSLGRPRLTYGMTFQISLEHHARTAVRSMVNQPTLASAKRVPPGDSWLDQTGSSCASLPGDRA